MFVFYDNMLFIKFISFLCRIEENYKVNAPSGHLIQMRLPNNLLFFWDIKNPLFLHFCLKKVHQYKKSQNGCELWRNLRQISSLSLQLYFFCKYIYPFFPICCAKIFYLESIVWQIACRKEKLLGTFQAYWSKKVSHIAIVGLFVEFIMYILTSKQFTVSFK